MDFDKFVENKAREIEEEMNKLNSLGKQTVISPELNIEVRKKMKDDIKKMVIRDYIGDSIDGNHKYIIKNNLKQVIKQSPYTQRDVAQRINISERTLSNIVNNKYNTSLEIALKLSYLLHFSMDDLFELRMIEK